jgi:peptidoglycan/LPS O-acetylase OafA/YrhL
LTVSTESNSSRPAAGNSRAVWSVVVGALSVATMPAAILGTRYSASYDLLHAAFAIPVAALLGIGALALARRARARDAATLGRAGGRRAARAGRALGLLGLCIASSALVAIAVYGVLAYVGSQD